jgi:hypothetical protein
MATIEDAIFEASKLPSDASIEHRLKLIEELRKSLPTDRWTFRWVIWGLGLVVVFPVVVICIKYFLAEGFDAANIPQAVVSLASTALGALAAYLTPRRPGSKEEEAGKAP